MSLQYWLTNALGESHELSNLWEPKPQDAQYGYTVKPLYDQPGGLDAGNPELGARNMQLRRRDVQSSKVDYVDDLNQIAHVCRQDARPVCLEEREQGYRQEVIIRGWGDSPHKGSFRHSGQKNIQLTMLSGVWEKIAETVVDSGGWLSSGDTLAVTNSGLINVACEIRILPQSLINSFTLQNAATSEGFTLATTAFIPGTEFVVDGRGSGLVQLNETDLFSALAVGSTYISLKPGVNNLTYTSAFGRCQVQVTFREAKYEV